MPHMARAKVGLLASVALVAVAACTPAGDATSTATSGPRTIEVAMRDELVYEPDAVAVSVGETVRFVVINAGEVVHEFYIGDETAQAAHEDEMAGGGMQHADPAGISVEPGQTGEIEFTFEEPGELLIGCHEPGHYAGGMVATITVDS